MPAQRYHPDTFISGFDCGLQSRKHMQGPGSLEEASQLPTWSLTKNDLPRGEKRSWEEEFSSFVAGKRRCERLTFFSETSRPFKIEDHQGFDTFSNSPLHLHETNSLANRARVENEIAAVPRKSFLSPNAIENVLTPRVVSGATTNVVGQNHGGAPEIAMYGITGDCILETANHSTNRQQAAKSSSRDFALLADAESGATGEQFQSSISWLVELERKTVVPIPKAPKDNLPVKDRKRFFIETPATALAGAMTKWVSNIYNILDPWRSDEECWLHPGPPPPSRKTGRAHGSIRYNFGWKNDNSSHSLSVSFGVVAWIAESFLTEAQKSGFINEGWRLSHLCGNWTCCNWRHFTIEPGTINVRRNSCFKYRNGCTHNPPCMKHLTRRLSITASSRSESPLPEEVPVCSPAEMIQNFSEVKSPSLSCTSQSQSTPYAEPDKIPTFSPLGMAPKYADTEGRVSNSVRKIMAI